MATVVRPGITRLRDASDVVAPAGAADDDKVWSYDHDTGKSTLVPQSQGVTDHAALSNLSYAASGHTGFEPAGAGDAAVAAHVALSDPHTQYLLESLYTAADILSKLLTVDTDNSGLNATTLQGNAPAAFATSGQCQYGGYSGLVVSIGTQSHFAKRNSAGCLRQRWRYGGCRVGTGRRQPTVCAGKVPVNIRDQLASSICVCLPFGRAWFTLDRGYLVNQPAPLRHMCMAYRLVNRHVCCGGIR